MHLLFLFFDCYQLSLFMVVNYCRYFSAAVYICILTLFASLRH